MPGPGNARRTRLLHSSIKYSPIYNLTGRESTEDPTQSGAIGAAHCALRFDPRHNSVAELPQIRFFLVRESGALRSGVWGPMPAKHVAVLMGGWSAEREVSLSSGKPCAEALETKGYRVTKIDVGRDIATG